MQTYERTNGSRFVLTNSTPEEWAKAIGERLLGLGCSVAYARKVARGYKDATPVNARS